MKKNLKRILAFVLVSAMTFSLVACSSTAAKETAPAAPAEAEEVAEEAQAADTAPAAEGYKIGWSNIYMSPSWMQEVGNFMDERIAYWKGKGIVSEYTLANANGDTSTQISQIENMISQGYDAIILIAGSATALNAVVDKCAENGVVVVSFDSVPTTDSVTSIVNNSNIEYGQLCADWMGEKLNGKGKVMVFTGPAGIASSEERANAAVELLAEKYPDIQVTDVLNSDYTEAAALDAVNPYLDVNTDLNGIIALSGTHASAAFDAVLKKDYGIIPITGEMYNGFFRTWDDLRDQGFSSIAIGHQAWLGVLAIDQAIKILQGEPYEKSPLIPLSIVTDETLDEYIPNDYPDDYFPLPELTDEMINEYLTPKN